MYSDSPTHNSDLSTNSLLPFITALLSLVHHASHTPPAFCPPAASLHIPLFSSIPSCWKGLTTRGAWITQLHSHPLNAFTQPWSRPSLSARPQLQHLHSHGVKGPCGPASPHLSCSQPERYLCPCGCFDIPHFISILSRNRMLSNTNSRRGSSSTYEDHALCMHYDMQEISSGDKNHEHERQSHYTGIRMQKRRKRITIYRAVCTVQQEIGSRPSTLRNKR